MGMRCLVCVNENQGEIDKLLLAGTPLRKIAAKYGSSATALGRHKRHISQGLVVAREAIVVARADTLLEQVRNLLTQAERLTAKAEHSGSLETALRGIGQIRGVLELLGQVSGQLSGKGTQIAIGISGGNFQPAPNFKTMSNEELEKYLHWGGQPPLLEARVSSGGA